MTESTTVILVSTISGAIAGAFAALPAIITAWNALPRIEKKIDEQTRVMDGPFTLAVKTAAEATAKLAEAVPSHENIKAAETAKVLNENREAGKMAAVTPPKTDT
jgi:hypothetical protein